MSGIDTNKFYMGININQRKIEYYVILKIHKKSENDEP